MLFRSVIGVVNNRANNDDIRSREINVAENNDKKDKPNTAIPGVNCFSEKGVAGIFFGLLSIVTR